MMNSKEYVMPNGKKVIFEYDINGVGKITLECMDELMLMIAGRLQDDTVSRQYLLAEIDDLADEFSELDENGLHSERWCGISDSKRIIMNAPTIEPKRGEWIEWIDCEGEVFWKCSACGQVSEASVADILYKFCPFCGADMRDEDDE